MLVLKYDALDLPAAGAPGAQLEADDNEELEGKVAAPITGRPLASSRPHIAANVHVELWRVVKVSGKDVVWFIYEYGVVYLQAHSSAFKCITRIQYRNRSIQCIQ